MATWEQLNFQNRISPLIEQFLFLHDFIVIILVLIFTMVIYTIGIIIFNPFIKMKTQDNHEIEVVWTFLPGLILIFIAFPSLRLLYITEENKENRINLKTIGHQWYWRYEYSDFSNIEFDRFILPLESKSQFRLLDTDNLVALPEKTPIRLFISSADVLHSWTIPTIGIKADSTPGRLNTVDFLTIKTGTYFGQCSEICGTNHRFIPIKVRVLPLKRFKTWLTNMQERLLENKMNF